MQAYERNIDTRLSDESIKAIFMGLIPHRLHEVYDDRSLADMHEFLVDIFKSEPWKNPAKFQERNAFIQSIRLLDASGADHRRVFLAMADAANSHAVISYLHMIGHKERVFMKNHQALLTTDDLTMIVKDGGFRIGPVVHYLCRASVVTDAKSLPRLWKELSKAYKPDERFGERFLEGMQTLVRRFGLKSLGLGDNDLDHKAWIDRFLTSGERGIKNIASSVVAGQLASRQLGRHELVRECFDLESKTRLVNDLGFDPSIISATKVVRSHAVTNPEYRLSEGLTR
jgi:hypothetical protein